MHQLSLVQLCLPYPHPNVLKKTNDLIVEKRKAVIFHYKLCSLEKDELLIGPFWNLSQELHTNVIIMTLKEEYQNTISSDYVKMRADFIERCFSWR